MIRRDAEVEISKKTLQECYALSKDVVTNEQDATLRATYHKMIYLEFLEFISRVADRWFRETELDEIPLYRKIEYLLERLVPLVGHKLQ